MHIRHDWLATYPIEQKTYSTLCGRRVKYADFPLQPRINCKLCLGALNYESFDLYSKLAKNDIFASKHLQDRIINTMAWVIICNHWSANKVNKPRTIEVDTALKPL